MFTSFVVGNWPHTVFFFETFGDQSEQQALLCRL